MKILLIDNYDSFTFNLFHYISKIKKNVEVIRNDKINGKTILKKKYDKIVISPGPGNPNQAGNCIEIVKEVYKMIKKSNHLNRLVTLSPLTEMARKFHLRNGAVELQVNDETQNFEYKVIK